MIANYLNELSDENINFLEKLSLPDYFKYMFPYGFTLNYDTALELYQNGEITIEMYELNIDRLNSNFIINNSITDTFKELFPYGFIFFCDIALKLYNKREITDEEFEENMKRNNDIKIKINKVRGE